MGSIPSTIPNNIVTTKTTIVNKIKELGEISNPTGNVSVDTKRVMSTSIYKDMDSTNKEALLVMGTKGMDAAYDYMMNPTGDRPLSYAEMRARFG